MTFGSADAAAAPRARRRTRALSRAGSAGGLAAAAVLLLVSAGSVVAQQVVFTGRGDPELDRRITAVLASGRYVLLARDTTLSPRDTLRGPVLAPGISVRLNGTVQGDLVGIASDLFIHPRAVVTGDVVNAGGGLYPSTLAKLGRTVDRPLASYTVTREGNVIHIEARSTTGGVVALDALRGLHIPVYDRVDGLWLQAGARIRLPMPAAIDSAALHLVGGWRTGGPGGTYTADLQVSRGRYTLLGGAQRLTATQDRWIRGDLSNSLAFVTLGTDYRDYYDSHQIFAAVARDFRRRGWVGHLALIGRREVDRSLRTRDTWVLFAPDSVRPNPAVADSTIASASLDAGVGWSDGSSGLLVGGEVERAGNALGGDLAFSRYAIWGEASVRALWGHTLNFFGRVQGPLPGTDALPRQRWSHVGGGATLPTYRVGTFPGDRVAFVSTEYVMPFPGGLRLPLVGPPSIALLHAAGMGWTQGQSRRLEQNLGVELRVLGLAVGVVTNPASVKDDLRLRGGFAFSTGRIRSGEAARFDTAVLER